MALQLAANLVNGLPISPAFVARDVAGFSANRNNLVARDDDKVVTLFIDSVGAGLEEHVFEASVVNACPAETVYAIRCIDGPSEYCGDYAAVTITENANEYRVSSAVATRTAGVDIKGTIIEECKLAGTTAATCTATVKAEADGTKYSSVTQTVYTPAASQFFDVTITAGAEKLANPTGKCTNSAPSTRAVALWGMLGAVGLVGVLAL